MLAGDGKLELYDYKKLLNTDRMSSKGKGVVVAVVDTGCNVLHPDLKGHMIDGRSFVYDYNSEGLNILDEDDICDNNGHGTHVAGIIASVAPEARLLILKGLSSSMISLTSIVADAVNYAVNWKGPEGEKVNIISLSLSTTVNDKLLHNAIIEAVNHNILVVCSAGNAADSNTAADEIYFPGAYLETVGVGACDDNGAPACFSSSSEEVDCVAPGIDISSAWNDGEYNSLTGTSQAVPFVSGCAALILSDYKQKGIELSESQLYTELMKCTRNLGHDERLQGKGIIDMAKYSFNDSYMKSKSYMHDKLIIFNGEYDMLFALLIKDFINAPMVSEKSFKSNPVDACQYIKIGGSYRPDGDVVMLSGSNRKETAKKILGYISQL